MTHVNLMATGLKLRASSLTYLRLFSVNAGVPQGSFLGLLLLLIYINNLSDNLISNPKLLADGTSLFSVIHNKDLTAKNLNDDLSRTNNWTFQWKMSFNPGANKQVQEVIFSRKIQKAAQLSLIPIINIVIQFITRKHLEMFLILGWISRNISRTFSVKSTRQLVYYGSSTAYCQNHFYLQFVFPLLDLISTVMAPYKIKHIMLHLTQK